ncbi:MAG: hypothetical protein WEB59_16515 [Thermoanaerobaculia bacterium]
MARRNRSVLLMAVLAVVPIAVLAFPLMHRTQTVIDVPQPGTDVSLSGLSYKGRMFEAKVTSVRLERKGESDADPVVADWTFAGSNSDGQMHRVEIFVRLLDESGKQLEMFAKKCVLPGGSHDHPCVVPMKVKAESWKATRSVRIVSDWVS